ncbi:MAG: hypothetical protein KDB00_04770 [Planctomycetales bacterium]|nr:hypothetical protein [Planctomycetales bacterium]
MNRRIKHVLAVLIFGTSFQICDAAETSTTALREQTRKQLRLESTATEGPEKDDAATALCDLYVVLRSDPRYPSSEMIQGDAFKVRRRLLTIARRREIQLGRLDIARPAELAKQVDAAIEESLAEKDVPDDSSGNVIRSNAGGAAAAGGGGWQLVELIERIVAPDFWESRGGAGSIRYFAMRRVLVVRATSDVHQQIKDLLMALR